MTATVYEFTVRDSTATPPGTPVTGLSPTFVIFKNKATNADITPQPAISAVGNGQYKFTYDPLPGGVVTEATYQVDAGSAVSGSNFDRYIDGDCLLSTQDALTVQGYTATRATFLENIATNLWSALTSGFGVTGSIGTLLAKLTFDGSNNVRASVSGYDTGQDPVSLLKAAPLSTSPTTGTYDEALAVVRALAVGRKVETISSNTMDVYAHDGVTKLFTITYAPTIAAPSASVSNR